MTEVDDAPEEAPGAPGDPGALVVRLLGVLAAVGLGVLLVGHFTLPIDQPAGTLDALTQSDLIGATLNTALVIQVLIVATLAIGSILRPSMGPEVLASATLTLPWLARSALSPFERDVVDSAQRTVQVATVLVVVAVVGALVLAARRVRLESGGMLLADAAVLVLAGGSLWATLGIGWYRLSSDAEGTTFGGLLDTDTWPSRGSWLGLLASVVLLAVVIVDSGFPRRVAGAVLAVLMGTEVVLRMMADLKSIYPEIVRVPFEQAALARGTALPTIEVGLVALVPPLLGLAAGVWMMAGARERD